jgi:hypothetical protein
LVQDIIDNDLLEEHNKPNHWVSYVDYDDNNHIKAVIKKTSKNEIYLQTLFKINKKRGKGK